MPALAALVHLTLASASLAPALPAAEADLDPSPPTNDQPEQGFHTAYLSITGLDASAVEEGLNLRIPDLETKTTWDIHAQSPRDSESVVFVSLRTEDTAKPRVQIDVVTGDGRGFSRSVDASSAETRIVTSLVANLLFSIERDDVEADIKDVALPQTSATKDVVRVVRSVERATQPTAEGDPELQRPTASEPVPVPTDSTPEQSEAEPEREDQPDPTPVRSALPSNEHWSIGAPIAVGTLLGLGRPNYGGVLQGGGLSTGLQFRSPRGLMFGLDARWLLRRKLPFTLQRVRIGLGAGYGLRKGHFELPVMGVFAVEPWFVSDTEGWIESPALDAPAPIALSAGVRLSPGYLVERSGRALEAVRLGGVLSLEGAFVPDDGARIAGIASDLGEEFDEELFRIGGLEMFVGVGAQFWFRLGPTSGTRKKEE